MNMETNLIEQLNESADGYKKQLEVAKTLEKTLPVAQWVTYVIAGGIDLYLFYLFGTYYKEMANVCAYVKRNPNKTTTE